VWTPQSFFLSSYFTASLYTFQKGNLWFSRTCTVGLRQEFMSPLPTSWEKKGGTQTEGQRKASHSKVNMHHHNPSHASTQNDFAFG
jgi:hypothetical protein